MQRLSLHTLLFAGLLALIAGGVAAQQGPPLRPTTDTTPIAGQPRILSTASLSVAGKRVVLMGVDPMMAENPCIFENRAWDCGTAALRILMNMIGREPVTCHPRYNELGGRIYAKCFVHEQDIALGLVEAGMAVTVPAETTEYETALKEAMAKKVGVWRGTFTPPAEFRKALRPDEIQPR
jgi:endonuclease YncB( thermonuclease family)